MTGSELDRRGHEASWREAAWFTTRPRRLLAVAVLVVVGAGVAALGSTAGLSCGSRNVILLELAGNARISRAVLTGCTTKQVDTSMLHDALFIVAYVLVLAASVWWFGRNGYRVRSLRRSAPRRMAVIVFVMGLLDGIEDVALRVGLSGSNGGLQVRDFWAAVATTASWAKWAFAVLLAAYLIGAVLGFVTMPSFVRRALFAADEEEQQPLEPGTVTGKATPAVQRRLGFSLSGGGVRSASFGLGVLQALEEDPSHAISWKQASKVTAVSGGAYTAGGFAIARTARADPGTGTHGAHVSPPASPPAPGADPAPWTPDSPEEVHLRDNLGYILSGTGGAAGALATLVLGLAINAGILLLMLWLVAVPVGRLAGSCVIEPSLAVSSVAQPSGHHIVAVASTCPWKTPATRTFVVNAGQAVPPAVWAGAGLALLVLWVLLGRLAAADLLGSANAARWLGRRILTPAMVMLAMGVALGVVLLLIPWAMVELSNGFKNAGGTNGGSWPGAQLLQTVVALGAATGLTATIKTTLSSGVHKRIARLGGVLLLLLALLIGGNWATHAAQETSFTGTRSLYVGLLLAAVVLWAAVSAEWWALGPAYRARLRRAYATWRPTPDAGRAFSYGGSADAEPSGSDLAKQAEQGRLPREPSLYQLAVGADPGRYPETIICATLNVNRKRAYVHHGIPAYSFTLSSSSVSYFVPNADDRSTRIDCDPATLEELSDRWGGSRLTPMSAVALAGAAVSSAMGRQSMGNTDAVLAFANIRLGAWMPNPRYAKALAEQRGDIAATRREYYPKVSLVYLFKELLGIYDTDDMYVYVTDGGHWENTGLAELVRPSDEADPVAASRDALTEIVCIDASGVSIESVTSLAEAIGLARLECEADIRIRFDALRARDDTGTNHYASRCATIGFVRRSDGGFAVVWYAKPVLSATDPTSLLAYAERDRTFPAVGTVDQFFDEEHFVAYRDIGRYAAGQILMARQALQRLQHHTYDQLQTTAAGTDPESWVAAEICALVDEAEWDQIRKTGSWPLIG